MPLKRVAPPPSDEQLASAELTESRRRRDRARRRLALTARREPRCLREKARLVRRSRWSKARCALGPGIASPCDGVASTFTPRSIPTASCGCATGSMLAVSTMMAANHLSASRLTVTRLRTPVNRTGSRILTQPTTGNFRRFPSQRNVPVSLAAQKLS